MNRFSTTRRLLTALLLVVGVTAAQAQTSQTHDTGTVTLQVFNNGILGSGASFAGTGFTYEGENGLFEGQLLVGLSATQVSGQAYATAAAHEWAALSSVTPFSSPFPGYDEAYETTYDDSAAPNPIGITVRQHSYSSSNASDDDYVLLGFTITNTSGQPRNNLYVGLFTDWDVSTYDQNLGGFDADNNLLYVWDNSLPSSTYFGLVALAANPANVSGWYHDVGDGANPTEAQLYAALTTPGTIPDTPEDRRSVLGVGPVNLAAGATETFWFAMVGGASLAELQDNAAAAFSAPVPVELVAFNAILDGPAVTLAWGTASETNNAGFEVQMKADDTWTVLGYVEGHGTTTEAQTYRFNVGELAPGTYEFRLKQIDFDGQFAYHGTLEVAVETPGQFVLMPAYPNPFNPEATVRFAVRESKPVTLSLHDVLGRQIATLYEGTPAANETLSVRIDGAGLPSGLYLIRMTGNGIAATRSVTLLK